MDVFANKYIVVTPGCGTACQKVGVIDLETGHPRFLKNYRGQTVSTSLGVEFYRDSCVLGLIGQNMNGDIRKTYMEVD